VQNGRLVRGKRRRIFGALLERGDFIGSSVRGLTRRRGGSNGGGSGGRPLRRDLLEEVGEPLVEIRDRLIPGEIARRVRRVGAASRFVSVSTSAVPVMSWYVEMLPSWPCTGSQTPRISNS